MRRRAALAFAAMLALVAGSVDPGDGGAQDAPAGCGAPPALMTIEPFLARAAARIEQGGPLTVVAVGSSSTSGVGATSPRLSYPSRLEAELREHLPGVAVRVLNRGKNGEDAPEELARLNRDVIAEQPDLVIWQVGTNAVLRRDDLSADDAMIRRGIALLKGKGSDVVLMDLQYAPRVTARPAHSAMERLIAEAAEGAGVGLFRRFAIMRHWQSEHPADAPPMVGPDGLHMTDRGYRCLASGLAEALVRNWRLRESAAQVRQARSRRIEAAASTPAP